MLRREIILFSWPWTLVSSCLLLYVNDSSRLHSIPVILPPLHTHTDTHTERETEREREREIPYTPPSSSSPQPPSPTPATHGLESFLRLLITVTNLYFLSVEVFGYKYHWRGWWGGGWGVHHLTLLTFTKGSHIKHQPALLE